MKVLLLNGSANQKGCTYTALEEIGRTLQAEGIGYEIFQMGGQPVRDCIGCRQCTEQGCVFADDLVNTFVGKAREADGFVFGTPVYYAHASGRILSFLDRAFYSSKDAFLYKPAAAVASARRAGTEQVFRHQQYAHRGIKLLEHGAWKPPGGSAAGCGGAADHAEYRPQYGLAAEMH